MRSTSLLVSSWYQEGKADPADLCQPCLGIYLAAANVNLNANRFTRRTHNGRDRKAEIEDVRIMLFLPTVMGDILTKIAIPIQQSDRYERNVHIARGLQMVTGKNSESAGIIREGIMNAVFCTKICGRIPCRKAVFVRRGGFRQVGIKTCRKLIQFTNVIRLGSLLPQP